MAVMLGTDASCLSVTPRRSSAACLRVRPARPGGLGSFGNSRLVSFEKLSFVGSDDFFDFLRRGVDGLDEPFGVGKRSGNGGVSDIWLSGKVFLEPRLRNLTPLRK